MEVQGRLVVVGGGYAGVLAAIRAAKRLGPEGRVVLVSAEDALVERIRLHETAARGRDPRVPIARLLRGVPARFVRARAVGLDLEGRAIETDRGPIGFERLILAIGSRVDVDAVPGIREHALVLDPGIAEKTAEVLAGVAARGGRVVVCGGGLTALEAATEIAEAHPGLTVRLVTGSQVGERSSARGREHLLRALERLQVRVDEGVRVDAIEAGAVRAGAQRIPFDVCIWAGGFVAPPLLRDAGVPVNGRGQAIVDAMLRVPGAPHVYVAGDAAAPAGAWGSPVVMGCKTAMPMGAHAAGNAAAAMLGREELPLRWRDTGLCVSLGRRDGLVQPMSAEGAPTRWSIRGRLGAWVKEKICRYTVSSIDLEAAGRRRYRWLEAGRAPRALAAGARPGTIGA
jgi:NADH dehydrogenase FAD-containing subunit